MNPRKTKEMNWSKNNGMYILADPGTNKTYNVDSVSFLIWVQCDGKTSVDEIANVLSVDGNKDMVKAAVKGILDRLEKSELIVWK